MAPTRKPKPTINNRLDYKELFVHNLFPLVHAPSEFQNQKRDETYRAYLTRQIKSIETQKLSSSIELIVTESKSATPDQDLDTILGAKKQKAKELHDRLYRRTLLGGLSWYESRRHERILSKVIETKNHRCHLRTCVQQQLIICLWRVNFADESLQSPLVKNHHDCSEMVANGLVDGKEPCDFSNEAFPDIKRKRQYRDIKNPTPNTPIDPLAHMPDPHSRWYWNKHRYHICVAEVGERGVLTYLCGHPHHPGLHYGSEAVITCNDVYVCQQSGSIHLCSDVCEYITDSSLTNRFCPISKRCGNPLLVDRFWNPNQLLSESTIQYEALRRRQPESDTWINNLLLCQTLGEINKHLREGWTIAQSVPCIYYNFVVSACMWALFCRQITDNHNDSISDLYRRRYDDCMAQLNTHKTKLEARGAMCITNTMIEIDVTDSRISKPFIVGPKSYHFISQLSNDIVKLWVLTKRLRQGRSITDIAHFTYAGADILRSGLNITSRGSEGVVFTESARYQLILPPFSTMTAMCSNPSDINICRQQIVDTITNAIERDGIPITSVNLMNIDLYAVANTEFAPMKPYNLPSMVKS